MVVANDADTVRIGTLRQRFRNCVGLAHLLVTNSRLEDLGAYIQRRMKRIE